MPSGESEHLIPLLKYAIRLSNYSYRDIERQLGWQIGTISRVMRGGLGLKIEHLLCMLRVINFSPGRFFAAAFPISDQVEPAEDRLFRLLLEMHGDPEVRRTRSALPAGGPTTQEEVDEMVRKSLRKLIGTVSG